MSMQPMYDWIDAHAEECLRYLQRLVRQPSISAQGVGLREFAAIQGIRYAAGIMEHFGRT